jgi:hypothetical protein
LSLAVDVDLTGLQVFRGRLETLRASLPRILDEAADHARRVMYDYAPRKTGRLAESITVKAPSELERAVGPTVEYASFVEYGRGWVYPVRARALRIPLEGGEIFRKSARPAAGRHFVEKTAFELRDALPQIAEKVLKEAVEE